MIEIIDATTDIASIMIKNISNENSLGCFSKLLLIKKLIDEKNIHNITCKFILLFKPIFIFF